MGLLKVETEDDLKIILRFSSCLKARRFLADIFKVSPSLDNIYDSAMLAYDDEDEANRLVTIMAREQQKKQ